MFMAAGVWILGRQWLDRSAGQFTALPFELRVSGSLYLATFAVLWLSSLPSWLAAVDGVTESGTRTGNLFHGGVSYAVCLLLLIAVHPRAVDRNAPGRVTASIHG
jgi:hypothetical protein